MMLVFIYIIHQMVCRTLNSNNKKKHIGETLLIQRFSELITSSYYIIEPVTYFQQCGMCDQQRLRPACAYAQSDQSLCKWLTYSMSVKLLTEHFLEFLSFKGGCRGLSESTLVKMPHFWKSHIVAYIDIKY